MKIIGSRKELEKLFSILCDLDNLASDSDIEDLDYSRYEERYFKSIGVSFEFLIEKFLVEENNEKNKISY